MPGVHQAFHATEVSKLSPASSVVEKSFVRPRGGGEYCRDADSTVSIDHSAHGPSVVEQILVISDGTVAIEKTEILNFKL
jgi:hypothetical protein